MTYNTLFAEIYVKYGKKNFKDGPALLELVKKVDPEIPVSQFTVIDYLTRQQNVDKLMAVRFLDPTQQDLVINTICHEMKKDYFVPEEETRSCAQGFLSVFSHGSKPAEVKEEEYDESMAPTMVMEPITLKDLETAPVLEELMDDAKDEFDQSEEKEDLIVEWPDEKMDILLTQRVELPEDLKNIPSPPVPETEASNVKKPKKVKKKPAKEKKEPAAPKQSQNNSQEAIRRAGRISTIVLVILLLLLAACLGVLFFTLKSMNIL